LRNSKALGLIKTFVLEIFKILRFSSLKWAVKNENFTNFDVTSKHTKHAHFWNQRAICYQKNYHVAVWLYHEFFFQKFQSSFLVNMFIFLDFSLNTSRAIKKEGLKISKTKYAVFVYYKLAKFDKLFYEDIKNEMVYIVSFK
jgi:hypothetical protein